MRSGLQLSAILTGDIKIEPSLEIRDDITVWHKFHLMLCFVSAEPLCSAEISQQ